MIFHYIILFLVAGVGCWTEAVPVRSASVPVRVARIKTMRRFFYHPWSKKDTPPKFYLIYILSVLFVFHSMVVSYSNSTYMERFATPEVIGTLYTIGSAIAVLAFLFMTRVLRRLGNVRTVIWLAVIELMMLLFMGLAFTPAITIVAFVTFLVINPLIFLNIDVFSESLIGDNEESTGSKRGLALALMSLASACGPFALGMLAGKENLLDRPYFLAASVFGLFIALVLIHFRAFKDPEYHELKVLSALSYFWSARHMRYVMLMQFLLQVFFAWTVIYMPLYLATQIGLGWDVLGSVIGVGLLAFVVLEYPIGLLADKVYGEKEMMAIGFLILAVSVSWIAFLDSTSFWPWALLMFITRTGASFVEVTCESYFFKHTKGSDANTISFFRLTRPLGFMFGSLLGSAALLFLPFNLIFVVLGLVMAAGLFFVIPIRDTR